MTQTTSESEPAQRRLLPLLLKTTLLSAFLHATPLLTLLSWGFDPADMSLNTEWIGKFQDLQGLGHGASGRWAKLDDTAPPPPEEAPEFISPPEPEVPEKVEVAHPPKDPPKKKKPKKRKKKTKKKVLKKKVAKAKPPTPKPEPESSTPKAVAKTSADALPGAVYAGPSKIPSLRNYAPGNARMTALIRIDRVRGTPLEPTLRTILEAVPDYRILLDETGIDPVRKFDAIFTASSNPKNLHATFLAIRHRIKKQDLRSALAKRFSYDIPWSSYRGYPVRDLVPPKGTYQDPRKLLLAGSRLAVVARREWLSRLTTNQPEDSALREDTPDAPPARLTMLDGLKKIERAADKDRTVVLMTLQGLYVMLPGYGRLPAFDVARISIKDISAPKVTIDLKMRTPEIAASFARDCPKLRRNLQTLPLRVMGLASYIGRARCSVDKDYVTVRADYTQAELLRVLKILAPFVPRPPALAELPKPPTPPAPADADMAPDMAPKSGIGSLSATPLSNPPPSPKTEPFKAPAPEGSAPKEPTDAAGPEKKTDPKKADAKKAKDDVKEAPSKETPAKKTPAAEPEADAGESP